MVFVLFQVVVMSLLHLSFVRLVCYYFYVWRDKLKVIPSDMRKYVNEKVVRM